MNTKSAKPGKWLGKSFLTLKDFSPEEIDYLIQLASTLKQRKLSGKRQTPLKGKNIALIFEKPSTRTRCAFTVAASDGGACAEYLGKADIMLGKKETVADTARVLGRMFDGIQFRGFLHETVEQLAKYAGVPVWNGLTDQFHPTQALADFLTVKEHKGRLKGIRFTYVGDARNNVANSLLIGAAKMGLDFRMLSPRQLFPDKALLEYAKKTAEKTKAKIMATENIDKAIRNADVVYTDVWVSMGEEEHFAERIRLLKPYRVNMAMLKKASKNVIFMHCLPSFHNRNTSIGEEIFQKYGITEMEVTDQVFESRHSVVFDQAENRVHTIKAVMNTTLAGKN